jgi:histidinol-phosphatase
MNFQTELDCALDAARLAASIQKEKRYLLASIEIKSDKSPVTAIDRECEQVVKQHILSIFPQDSFLGEETGEHRGSSNRRWVVDPLDGTRPYIRDIPTYSVLISLEEAGTPVVGVIYLPSLDICCYASKNSGAFCNGKSIRVSDTAPDERVIGSALGFRELCDTPEGKQLFECMKSWDYNYGFMDAYSYVCVASGKLDCTVNLLDKPWDCSAAACIITEAGGTYSDLQGNKSVYNGAIVFSNSKLHDSLLRFFK